MKKFVSIVIVLTLVLGLIPTTTTFAYHEHYFEEIVTQRNSHPHKAVIECECGETINLPSSYLYGCTECKDIFCNFPIYLHDYSIVTKTNTGITAECECKPNTFYTFDNEEEWESFYRENINELHNAYEELTIELANERYVDSKENDVYVDLESIFSKRVEEMHPHHGGMYEDASGDSVYVDNGFDPNCRYCVEQLCCNFDFHSFLCDYEVYENHVKFFCFCGESWKVSFSKISEFIKDRMTENRNKCETLNVHLASERYEEENKSDNNTYSSTYTEPSTLSGEFYSPQALSQGEPYEIRGNFSSNYKITSLTIYVKNSNGSTVMSSRITPYSYDIVIDASSQINQDIRFEYLPSGLYTVCSEVIDESGATGTSEAQCEIVSNTCPVEKETTITFNFTSLPETIRSTGGFNLTGKISSDNASITEIYGYIKDTNENTYDSSYDMVMSNVMDIQPARLNQDLSFGSLLHNGQYKLVVVAKTSNGEVVFEHYFTVERGSFGSPSYTSDTRSIVYYTNFTPTFFEVTKDEAPLRSIPYKEGTTLAKIKKGTILRLTGKSCNDLGHIWYIMEVDGEKGYIYAENVTEYVASDGRSKWQTFLDETSMILTAFSVVPVIDTGVDAAATIVDLLRGDFTGAGLSALGIIPVIGEGADALKTAKLIDKGIDTLKVAEKVDDVLDATKITGFTKHGLAQVMGRDGGRGVSNKALIDTINAPIQKIIQKENGTIKYVGENAVVVLNAAGEVVTAYAKNKFGIR